MSDADKPFKIGAKFDFAPEECKLKIEDSLKPQMESTEKTDTKTHDPGEIDLTSELNIKADFVSLKRITEGSSAFGLEIGPRVMYGVPFSVDDFSRSLPLILKHKF